MSEENSTPEVAAVEASTPEAVYEKAIEFKSSGNTYFKNKQYQEAYNAYTNAINMFVSSGVEYKRLSKTAQLQQCLEQLSACHTNIALCFLKCDQNEQGIHFATSALKYDSKNSKALYLRGKMLRLEGELQQAKRDMHTCLMIQPENEEAQQELELIEKEIQDELQRRRALQDDDSDEDSSDPSGMINPQVLRMLRSMNLGGGFNPMMFRGMGGMGGMKSSEEMYQEELEKAIKLSIAEEEERKKKEEEAQKKAEELQQQQDEMKRFFEEQEKKRKEEIEKEQTPVEESIDEPFEVELDDEEEEEEGGEEGEDEEEVEVEGEEGEEEFDIDEADLDNLEEYKPEEEQGQEAD